MKKAAKCKTPYCRKYAAKNSTLCHACNKRNYRDRNPVEASYQNLRSNARRRGKQFDITLEEFREFAIECNYITGKGRHKDGFHVDRIDPTKGYTKDNIQVLTNSENVKKHKRYLRYEMNKEGKPDFKVDVPVHSQCSDDEDLPF